MGIRGWGVPALCILAIVCCSADGRAAEAATAVENPSFQIFLSPKIDGTTAIGYTVRPGDTLSRIASRHGVTVDLLKRVNRLPGDLIRSGAMLKIPKAKVNVVVDKSENLLFLKAGEDVLKTYRVSTGLKNGTPSGVFRVTDKLVDPTWYRAGAVVPPGSPDNILGPRWLGLSAKGYGIHGTTEPEKLGQQVTAGCVRMKNEDVEEVYGLLPSGAEVTIVD